MIPVIALIGHQNVGKSTLFNKLSYSNNTIAKDILGLTRDRNYEKIKWKKNNFIIIDTGGIVNIKKNIESKITKQSLIAIEEADIIYFIVDARTGLIEIDLYISKYLRNSNKIIILVINKIDGIDKNFLLEEFYSLGIKYVFPITAIHGNGIDELLKKTFYLFLKKKKNESNLFIKNKKKEIKIKKNFYFEKQKPIELAIIGRSNVGKSTIINYLFGKERLIVSNGYGTTRESIKIPLIYNNQKYILIDTAGINKINNIKNKIEILFVKKTISTIKKTNIVLFIIDAYQGISNEDLSLINFILKKGKSLIIAFNKLDKLSKSNSETFKKSIFFRLNFINFVKIHFISALYGDGIYDLFESVKKSFEDSNRRINSSLLTKIMHKAIKKHQPPLINGRRIKPKYVHIGKYNPLTFVVHGTQVKKLNNTYKRYLIKCFNSILNIIGTKIFLKFNETINPFKKKCNYQSLRQINKKI